MTAVTGAPALLHTRGHAVKAVAHTGCDGSRRRVAAAGGRHRPGMPVRHETDSGVGPDPRPRTVAR